MPRLGANTSLREEGEALSVLRGHTQAKWPERRPTVTGEWADLVLAAIPKTALSNARKHRSDGGQGQQPVGQMNSIDVDDGCPLRVRVLRGDDCLVRANHANQQCSLPNHWTEQELAVGAEEECIE